MEYKAGIWENISNWEMDELGDMESAMETRESIRYGSKNSFL